MPACDWLSHRRVCKNSVLSDKTAPVTDDPSDMSVRWNRSLHLSFWIFGFVTLHLARLLPPSPFLLSFLWICACLIYKCNPRAWRKFSRSESLQNKHCGNKVQERRQVIAMKDLCNNTSWCTFNSLCNRDRWETKRTTGRRAEEGDKGWFIPAVWSREQGMI